MEDVHISNIDSSSPKYLQVWQLREEVLRKPLGLSLKNEDLSNDHVDTIFIAEHNGGIIGCLMLHKLDDATMKFRQMAVYEQWQGKGIGKMLMLAAEVFCRDKKYRKISLHARKVAAGFYEGLGYTVLGNEFSEVGISHFLMEKPLQ